MWKKVIYSLLAIALVIAGVFAYQAFAKAQSNQNIPITQADTTILEEGNLTTSISAIGKVRSNQQAILVWKTSGTVESINAEPGAVIEYGQTLASLSQVSLPQNLIMAQADLVEAEKALEDLETNAKIAATQAMQNIVTYSRVVKDAQYQLDNFTPPASQIEYDAMQALDLTQAVLDTAREAFEPYKYYPSSHTLRQELKETLDQAQSEYNAAVKRVEYEYQLTVAQDNLDKARQDYEKWIKGPDESQLMAAQSRIAAAQASISQASIQAPFSGTITRSSIQTGDQVNINQEAFRMDDLSTLYVELQVSEVDINLIKAGQEVSLSLDAIRDKEYQGVVIEKGLVGIESGSVVNFNVTVKIIDADQDVRPGMTSEVEILISQNEKALLVPNQAIRSDATGAQVIYKITENGEATAVAIQIGASSNTHSEILSGDVKAGDQILLNPSQESQEAPGMMFGSQLRDPDAPSPHDVFGGQP